MILKQFQGEGIPFGLNLFFMHVTHPFSHDYFIRTTFHSRVHGKSENSGWFAPFRLGFVI